LEFKLKNTKWAEFEGGRKAHIRNKIGRPNGDNTIKVFRRELTKSLTMEATQARLVGPLVNGKELA
jgi:hypothetical protein